jgi:gamma-glutamylcyclotransferase (GGCT)/AIG2-like uncharacterized protein YtfP
MAEAQPIKHASPAYIAFYGSLMQSQGMQRDLRIADQVELIGPCQIFGILYDLGDYPGLIESATDRVQAELYRIKDPAVLVLLDAYEDYDPNHEASSLYLRRMVRLAEPDLDCWVYFYNRDVFESQRMPTGSWVKP